MIIQAIKSILEEIANDPKTYQDEGTKYEIHSRMADQLIKNGFSAEEIWGRTEWGKDQETGFDIPTGLTNVKLTA